MTAPRDIRANQKQRTRDAIVKAATELLRQGVEPSVTAAALAAKVSRATAYRYFPTPESLHIEVAGVTPAYAQVERLAETLDGEDAAARLQQFVEAFNATTFADEARMRMALKAYLDTWFANMGTKGGMARVREGRRMRWLAQVLAPVRPRQPDARWRRLEAALALTMGADAMIVMKDVCGLKDDEAQAVLRWASDVLLRAGLSELADGSKPKRR